MYLKSTVLTVHFKRSGNGRNRGNTVMNSQRTGVEHGMPAGLVGRLLAEEDGVTAIEYGLLAALIVVAAIGALTATGGSLEAMYTFWSGAVVAAL